MNHSSICKSLLSKFGRHLFLSIVLLSLLSVNAFATHFRYGLITSTRLSETATTVMYRLNVSLAWRLTAAPGSAGFSISGGNSGSVNVTLSNVTDPSGGWTNSSGTANVTLNKTATLTKIEFTSCCKISTLANNHDMNWDVYTIINTNAAGSSPVSTLPAIINMPINAAPAVYTIPASDPDAGSTLTYGLPNLVSGPLAGQSEPAGFSVNPSTGQISFNTVGKSVGQQYNAMVTVTDNNGNQVMLDFIINMVGASNPPVFDYGVTPADGSVFNVIAGQTISFPIKATDSDPGSTVGFSVSGLPVYITTSNFSPSLPATGNPAVTNFSWTPAPAQIGVTVVLNFIATDNVGVQASSSVTIKVVAEPAPVFISPTPVLNSITQIQTGQLFTESVVAQSPLGSNVSVAFATGIPAGAVLSPSVPTAGANPGQTDLSWTPVASDFGLHTLSFQATIASTPTIFTTTFHQLIVNTPPVFASLPVTTAIVGQLYTYNVSVNDDDIPFGDVVNVLGTTIPSWLTFIPTGNGTALLQGTPGLADVGTSSVDLEAEDTYHHGNPSVVGQSFSITVPPPVTAGNNGPVCSGSTLSLTSSAGFVIYSWSGPNGFTSADQNPSIGTVPFAGSGTYTVTVTDVNGFSASAITTAIVHDSPLASSTSGTIACNGGTTTVNVSATGGTAPYSGTGSYTVGAGDYSYTVTDANGCTSVTTITITEPTALVASAGPDKSVYFGYTPQSCATLNGSATGGTPGYSYTWSSGATAVSITVCPSIATTYTLTVKDANGCLSTSTVKVCVTDVRCSKGGNAIVYYDGGKVLVCHVPSEDYSKRFTICIAPEAVPDHLAHGDQLGICNAVADCSARAIVEEANDVIAEGVINLTAYPNPFNEVTTIRFSLPEAGNVALKVYSMVGKEVAVLFEGNVLQDEAREVTFRSGDLANGIYFCKLITATGEVKAEKILLAK